MRDKGCKKRVVTKILFAIILAVIAMVTFVCYKSFNVQSNIKTSVDAVVIDNYGFLNNEEIILNATLISDKTYELELPEFINDKKTNKYLDAKLVESNNETELEIKDNKIQLTEEQLKGKNAKLEIQIKYDLALIYQEEADEQYYRSILSEISNERIENVQINQVLCKKLLKYEDIQSGKVVEVEGYLPENAKVKVEPISEERITEIFDDGKIDVAYDIKIINPVKVEVNIDENNPEKGTKEIIEEREMTKQELGELCDITIKDSNISVDSKVYYINEDNTYGPAEIDGIDNNEIKIIENPISGFAISKDRMIDEKINVTAVDRPTRMKYSTNGGGTWTTVDYYGNTWWIPTVESETCVGYGYGYSSRSLSYNNFWRICIGKLPR